jgi:hypothetical protein
MESAVRPYERYVWPLRPNKPFALVREVDGHWIVVGLFRSAFAAERARKWTEGRLAVWDRRRDFKGMLEL